MSEPVVVGGNSAERLRSLVERIERLEEEKKALATDIKEIYMEAKSAGFDAKIIRQLIRERQQDANAIKEHEALLETYRRALGGYADTPLGAAAMKRADA